MQTGVNPEQELPLLPQVRRVLSEHLKYQVGVKNAVRPVHPLEGLPGVLWRLDHIQSSPDMAAASIDYGSQMQ